MAELTKPQAATAPQTWRLAVLGESAALSGPGARWHPGPASALLLTYLALEGPTPRQRLAGMLWPERTEARARANLRQLLLRIRAVAPVVEGEPLQLAPAVWVDARDLPPEDLGTAAAASLLAGLDASRYPPLADWLAARRSEHDTRLRRNLQERIASAREAGDLEAAAASAERLARLDSWSESACRTVMEIALARGEPAAALRAFRRLRRELASELGAEPSSQTVSMARRAARTAGTVQPAPARQHGAGLRLAHRAESGGWLREGAELLVQMAAGLEQGSELAGVLTELAWLEHRLGWNRRAREHAVRALGIARARPGSGGEPPSHGGEGGPGAPAPAADACFVLGSLAWAGGELAEARDRWGEALRALRRDDGAARLRVSLDLALVEDALDHPEAASRHYAAALTLARSMNELEAQAKILNNLGEQLARDGRPGEALVLLRRAHTIARERRDPLLEGYILDSIARAHLASDPAGARDASAPGRDAETARAAAARAAAIGAGTGDVRLQIEALLTLARATLAAGDADAARRLADAALARADASGWQPLAAAARELLCRAPFTPDDRDGGADVTPA